MENIKADIDPCETLEDDVAKLMTDTLEGLLAEQSPSGAVSFDELIDLLAGSPIAVQDLFLERLTEGSYNIGAMCTATGLKVGSDVDPAYDQRYKHFVSFFTQCMTGSFCEDRLLEVLHAIPLEATADLFLSRSMRRLSPTNGLPDDGHVLHTAVQGKASFLFFGQDRNIQVEAVEGTESKWELPGHHASVFVTGESAAGKDTVIKILDAIDASI